MDVGALMIALLSKSPELLFILIVYNLWQTIKADAAARKTVESRVEKLIRCHATLHPKHAQYVLNDKVEADDGP